LTLVVDILIGRIVMIPTDVYGPISGRFVNYRGGPGNGGDVSGHG
jgi:hypothetical protein